MRLRSMRCPNCAGAVKETEDGRCYCDSCGTTFMIDMDPEDVEYEKIKRADRAKKEIERKSREIPQQVNHTVNTVDAFDHQVESTGSDDPMMKTFMVPFILIVPIGIMVLIAVISSSNLDTYTTTRRTFGGLNTYRTYTTVDYAQISREVELRLNGGGTVSLVPGGDIIEYIDGEFRECLCDPEDLGITSPGYELVLEEEPEYITSYLMFPDSNSYEYVRLVNIYRVSLKLTSEDGTSDQIILYDSVAAVDPVVNSDGIVSCSGAIGRATSLHELDSDSDISVYGYTDMEELLDATVTGANGYSCIEFIMPFGEPVSDDKVSEVSDPEPTEDDSEVTTETAAVTESSGS